MFFRHALDSGKEGDREGKRTKQRANSRVLAGPFAGGHLPERPVVSRPRLSAGPEVTGDMNPEAQDSKSSRYPDRGTDPIIAARMSSLVSVVSVRYAMVGVWTLQGGGGGS